MPTKMWFLALFICQKWVFCQELEVSMCRLDFLFCCTSISKNTAALEIVIASDVLVFEF